MLIQKINTVTGRILALILSSLIGTFILAIVSLLQIHQVFQAANLGNESIVPQVVALDKASANYGRLRTRIYRYLVTTAPQEKADVGYKVETLMQEVKAAFTAYQAILKQPEEKSEFEKTEQILADFLRQTQPVLALSREQKTDEAITLLNSPAYKQYSDAVYDRLAEHMLTNQKRAEQASHLAQDAKQEALRFSIILFLVIAVCLTFFGLRLSRFLKKQLGGEPQTVVFITDRIAHGDLSSVISLAPRDQTSILASMDKMQNALKTLLSEIEEVISQAAKGHFTAQIETHNKQGFALEISQKLNQLNQSLLK